MEGEDEADKGRRSIPSLAHALEEARSRAKQHYEAPAPDAHEASLPDDPTSANYGSLLDLAQPMSRKAGAPQRRIELARLAMEADAARRALSGSGTRPVSDVQESMDEIRATLDECLAAVRECREMVRALAARRDRNYF